MKAFRSLFKTEFKLSLRGMDMFIFAICMPVVMVVILGIIYGSKPAFDGAQYTFLEQSFGQWQQSRYVQAALWAFRWSYPTTDTRRY